MGNACGELLAEFIGQVVVRSIITAVILLVDKYIVQRRDAVIRGGRQAQNRLRMPECLRVFTETDPGMSDEAIRDSAYLIVFCCFLTVFASLVALVKETVLDKFVLGFGVVGPACVLSLLWLGLILSKRRRERTQTYTGKEGNDTPRTTTEGGERDLGIRYVWTAIWV
ncbi:hypothetical protein DL546_008174 [Coniochaeta pulveracea]|uniref:Uncharacterized protein n=1 Tax=Coniochaeta pulveracea TaxID=177199 RepID=A0A420YL03_9PEZI|nr:hypothetical protein DL546_008174 [Coniochaeta pulveracea]